jgi:hypothetical protein
MSAGQDTSRSTTASGAGTIPPEAAGAADPRNAAAAPGRGRSTIRRFLFKLLLLGLPVLLLVAAVNLIADPANLFQSAAYEAGIARILAEGKNVAGLGDYNDRLMLKEFVALAPQAPDVLVLGSSRAMQIRASSFPGRTFFNAAVAEGTLADAEAIIQLYLERGLKPGLVMISMDPWDLQEPDWLTRWTSLYDQRAALLAALDLPAPPGRPSRMTAWRKWDQLLSPSYFQASCRALAAQVVHGGPDVLRAYKATTAASADGVVKLADGSLVYDKKMRSKTAAAVQQEAKTYAAKWQSQFRKVARVKPAGRAELEALVAYLQDQGIRVCFYLGPYHPTVYSEMRDQHDYRIGGDMEDYLRELGARLGVAVVGSYDPVRAGVAATDFFDGLHVKDTGAAKVLKRFVP